MTESFDLVRDLPSALRDRASAWAYIRGFAADWHSPLTPADGVPDSELTAAEQRLGLTFPAAVREAYALFGRRTAMHSNLNDLLSPGDFYVDVRNEALVFREENQYVAAWGVLLTDLGKPDPPVHVCLDPDDKDAEGWKGWLGSFSITCIEIVLSETLQIEDALSDSGEAPDDEELEQRLTRLPFPTYPDGEEGQSFYTAPGLLVSDGGGAWISARARDEDTLDRFRDDFPADWLG